MKKYVGIGVYDAVAEGNIAVYGKEEYVPEKVYRGDLPGEKARLEAAREAVREQLEESRVRTLAEAGAEVARIFEVHKMLLDDGEFNGAIRLVIEREGVNAEYAVAVTAEGLAALLMAEGFGDLIFVNQAETPERLSEAERLAALLDRPVFAGTLKGGIWKCLS